MEPNIKETTIFILIYSIVLIFSLLISSITLPETFSDRRFYVILKTVLGFGVFIAFYFFRKSLREIKASTKWPSVEGEIVASKLGVRFDDEGVWIYKPNIIYSYLVGGREYHGERIIIMQAFYPSKSWAQKQVDKYPLGLRVNVYYNPDAPKKAVLEPGMNFHFQILWFVILPLFGGIIWLIFSEIISIFIFILLN
ncbi:MAG: DUF3592 domain-containing protein [Promethearchaeota archaeon]